MEFIIYIIIWYWVCLFVRYRNHLPVVQFQNQTHIRKIFIAVRGGGFRHPKWGAAGALNFYYFLLLLPPPKAAVSQMGAEGATAPEGEENPAEGGCFASIYIYIYTHTE